MDRNRIIGAARQARGALKEAVGKLTGDEILSGDGRADKLEGKMQSAIGSARDANPAALTATRPRPASTSVDSLSEVKHDATLIAPVGSPPRHCAIDRPHRGRT